MIDQQAPRAGNYVGVTEISSPKSRNYFKGTPINLCCAPLSEIWGGFPTRIHIPNLSTPLAVKDNANRKTAMVTIDNTVNRHVKTTVTIQLRNILAKNNKISNRDRVSVGLFISMKRYRKHVPPQTGFTRRFKQFNDMCNGFGTTAALIG